MAKTDSSILVESLDKTHRDVMFCRPYAEVLAKRMPGPFVISVDGKKFEGAEGDYLVATLSGTPIGIFPEEEFGRTYRLVSEAKR